ncbi:sister chromatid cohesion protein DCC1 isoform X2 [Rhynchophorus ferrugineus]|uniref:sister chromatid cohesion protein DCC1 isoform X2 n=1 Tax=Rhynchophorus ferrugineus TaxID=354439 RepID=UPI003FCD59CE
MSKINSERELKDVNEILEHAKLTENDILPTSQALFFASSDIHSSNVRLLELNSELLKAIEANEVLTIKGEDDDEVVICTSKSTFRVTEAETSNNLLLIKSLQFSNNIQTQNQRSVRKVEICNVFQEYLEATPGRPHLNKLYDILSNTIYRGPEYEYEIEGKQLYSLEELKGIVQSSDRELNDAIKAMDVVEIDGKIREIDFEYHFRVLSYMLKLIEENSWDLDMIDYDVTCESLSELVHGDIVKSLFEKYTEDSRVIDGLPLYRYKEFDVCQFFARVLLKEAGKFNLEEFLQAWRDSVPEGMVTSEDMLYGIAIINRKSIPSVIWSFEETSLPDNINERFKVLFDVKEKWSVPEITPYIRSLTTDKLDVNALLAKHARASKVDGVKYYSAKHAK